MKPLLHRLSENCDILLETVDINKRNTVTLYHGNTSGTTTIEPSRMYGHGNNQEGVGIYFAKKLETAQHYGSTVLSLDIEKKSIKNADDTLRQARVNPHKLLLDAQKQNEEAFFYYTSDRIMVTEPSDVTTDIIRELSAELQEEELQNFQIDMAEIMGVVPFVNSWNKYFGNRIRALRGNTDKDFYAVIWDRFEPIVITE